MLKDIHSLMHTLHTDLCGRNRLYNLTYSQLGRIKLDKYHFFVNDDESEKWPLTKNKLIFVITTKTQRSYAGDATFRRQQKIVIDVSSSVIHSVSVNLSRHNVCILCVRNFHADSQRN